ncbi:MAG: OmpH family outer membrane protein [Phycisphaerales bacterium]|nr:OmpH family outer membrane protein [Phycisphaerales bacterium]
MFRIRHIMLVGAALIVTGTIAVTAARGTSHTLADKTVVAVVNPTAVLEGLLERADAEAELRSKFEEFKSQADSRTSEIRQLQERLEETTDPDAQQAIMDEIDAKGIKAIAFDQFAARQLDVELSLLQQNLYQRIVAAVGDLAQANGIDIVLVNDNATPIRVNPEARVARATQVEEQIAQRRVMFASPKVDITESLILRMNNAYNETATSR